MSAGAARYGVTVPLGGPLHSHRDQIRELVDLGYTDLWSAEADGADGFTPLVLASQWAPELRLGIAIIPAFTRGPALLAQTVASMADAAPGRFVMGLGSSSNVIVERWNGIPFEEPFQRTRDTLRFLRQALTGEKTSVEYDSFTVRGFRCGVVPEQQPPILVAALRSGMLRLAGREGDGAIINWLSADDVATVARHVREGAEQAGGGSREIVARVFVIPSADADEARGIARFAIAAYLNVPVYAAFHEWLGRGDRLRGMWDHWQAGDRKAALAAIPDDVVDELVIHGTPERCRELIDRYHEQGVTTSAIALMGPPGADAMQSLRDLAPAARK
ncbi:MAG: LLM class F420-dependent oxidoreductase [Actinomycetota bacterium]